VSLAGAEPLAESVELHAVSASMETALASRIRYLINIITFPFKKGLSKAAIAAICVFYQLGIP
jgi:hypothetical protein